MYPDEFANAMVHVLNHHVTSECRLHFKMKSEKKKALNALRADEAAARAAEDARS